MERSGMRNPLKTLLARRRIGGFLPAWRVEMTWHVISDFEDQNN
jgi:hypothetical protein